MIADFHNDILTVKKLPVDDELRELNSGILALYKGDKTFEELFFIASNYNGKFKLAFENIEKITDLELEKLILLAPIYVTLTWNFENDLAYGCYSNGKLKERGKKVVKKLTENNILIDTAHLSKQSFLNLCDITDKIVNSHTCFSGINKNLRNVDDEQLYLLNSVNACIGVTFVGSFLTNNGIANSDNVIKHVDYYVQKHGTKGIAIGSDYFGTNNLPVDLTSYNKWDILNEKLLNLGYTKQQTNDVLYDNLNKLIAQK